MMPCQVCLRPAVGECLLQYKAPAPWWWRAVALASGSKR